MGELELKWHDPERWDLRQRELLGLWEAALGEGQHQGRVSLGDHVAGDGYTALMLSGPVYASAAPTLALAQNFLQKGPETKRSEKRDVHMVRRVPDNVPEGRKVKIN